MILQTIKFKNFFSSGNSFVELDLRKYKTAILAGTNGMGKSSLLSAITFGLFGKTIKQVTKNQIINSINGKNCIVEIDLMVGNDLYLIRRGIKPNIFEIMKNGVLIDQTDVNDYQDYLEENILKCTFRTFLQTSVISIENYKPFMSLSKAERRDFIEDILDIKVFTFMNQLIKSKITKNKDELKLVSLSMQSVKDKIKLLKYHIESLERIQINSDTELDNRINDSINTLTQANLVIRNSNLEIKEYTENLVELKKLQKEKSSIESKLTETKTSIKHLEKELAYLEENTHCPTCKQEFDSSSTKQVKKTRYEILNREKEELLNNISKYDGVEENYSTCVENISRINSIISAHNSIVSMSNKNILEAEKEKQNNNTNIDIQSQKDSLKELGKEGLVLSERQTTINTEQDYNSVMLELFKDSGIKSKIVDQYIPVINSLVNQYLDKLDFFVSFNLDSEFNEIIKSRHRDDFTYSSFSAGEKQRIDAALLFTFRQLAKTKNSFSCNLLALDELLDASLDSTGIELMMNILSGEEFSESNILVISHGNKEKFEDVFEGCYNVTKRDGFTQISDL